MPRSARGSSRARVPLSRDRVLRCAISRADERGIRSLSMRSLAQDLGVDPMSLYKYVASKEDLLGGMLDAVIGEIEVTSSADGDWKNALRAQALAARATMRMHPWARQLLETRTNSSRTIALYYEAIVRMFREAGVSLDLTHHALHALGSRLFGFTQGLFEDSSILGHEPSSGTPPNLWAMIAHIGHDPDTIIGSGCDDQVEFEFALDLILHGIERLHLRGENGSPHGHAVRQV